jgi:hypothetical protein
MSVRPRGYNEFAKMKRVQWAGCCAEVYDAIGRELLVDEDPIRQQWGA